MRGRPSAQYLSEDLQLFATFGELNLRGGPAMTDATSRREPKMTAGIDLGDRYSYLCFLDTQNGEVIKEGRLRTTPEGFRRRFCSERPLRVAIQAGTHSPWVSRLLEECGQNVAKKCWSPTPASSGSSTPSDERQIDSMPRSWHGWPGSTRSC